METKQNTLLGGRVQLIQPETGFRSGMDAVFLASSITAKPGDRILDVGCGVGAASLCLLERCPEAHVTGIDIQKEYIELARENAILNNRMQSTSFLISDINASSSDIEPNSFDHVISNPPYFSTSTHTPPSANDRAAAHVGDHINLEQWISYCIKMTRSRGHLSFIFRAERLDEIMGCLIPKVGELTLTPLWPKANRNAKLVIIQGRKSIKSAFTLKPGILIHESEGAYTKEAESILRDALPLTNS